MLDLRRVRLFHAVVEHGSFSTAANALDYTQPAVSHHVAALERELGQRLINRSRRPLTLTAAGERLHAAAVIALAEFERAEADLTALAKGEAGTAALGSVVTGLRTVVPTATHVFRRRFPEVELTLVEAQPGELLADLRSGRLDVVIVVQPDGAEPPDPGTFVAQPLLDQAVLLAVPEGHRLARRKAVRLAELTRERWVMPAPTRWADFRGELDALLAGAGVAPVSVVETTDDLAGAQLVAAGEGIGLAPRLATLPLPGVVFVPLRPAVNRRLLAVAVAGPMRAPVRALIAELATAAAARGPSA